MATTVFIANHNGLPAIRRGRHGSQQPPLHVEEARAELRECATAIDKINFGLRHPMQRHHDGRPITPAEHKRWREEAEYARVEIAERSRYLKAWIHRHESARLDQEIDAVRAEVAALRAEVAALRAELAEARA